VGYNPTIRLLTSSLCRWRLQSSTFSTCSSCLGFARVTILTCIVRLASVTSLVGMTCDISSSLCFIKSGGFSTLNFICHISQGKPSLLIYFEDVVIVGTWFVDQSIISHSYSCTSQPL